MGLPGHRRTSSSRKRRAAHFAIKRRHLATCSNCGARVMPHRVCPSCGYYRKTLRARPARKKAKASAKT